MQFLETFRGSDFADTLASLIAAFAFATLIGAERQWRQRTAGLRTNVLVAVGACQFVDMAMNLTGHDGAVRVIAYVVSGIGFLGAGVIMKEGANIRGLNTAATLWCSAAVGACAGADLIAQAGLLTLFVLAGNIMLRPLAKWLERLPTDVSTGEATFEVVLVVETLRAADLKARVTAELQAAKYPVADIVSNRQGDQSEELTARLVATSAKGEELDSVVETLRELRGVSSAGWLSRTL
ncbi:putative Mg2+ transporter-C (MgtC) family protein [Ancylobacter aquaticus]|uniref:Protein MgtC n=1 Tax=Ancylobacter aquaticus TaxID=100 RepID=A0A4V2PJH6_ANCAQ|nr:MgtC/SapB family protein [Ancylobacter aquaticus]TCK28536.1 putative Mg2+ transporter-C (MgtC) family protein [Ancylobacter aquaticus]